MSTKHKKSISTSKIGVNYVKSIVENNNCIFQEVSLDNDVGNDAYIEFVENEVAIGFAVWVQIKSGSSYVKPNGNFILKADKKHFVYWHSHLMPVATIIYDPEIKVAVWANITEYFEIHPEIIENGPYSIEIPSTQQFTFDTFQVFFDHFLVYRSKYKNNLSVALEKFSDRNNEQNCLQGISYLFVYYRNSFTSWYYIICCFQNFRGYKQLFYLINLLAYLPGHQDIFWHKHNRITEEVSRRAVAFIAERFTKLEVLCMLELVTAGGGFARGAIGQDILAIILHINNIEKILESITFDEEVQEDARYWALLLLIYFVQENDPKLAKCIEFIARFQRINKGSKSDIHGMVEGIYEEIKRSGKFYLFC